jgi:hypothetical protein
MGISRRIILNGCTLFVGIGIGTITTLAIQWFQSPSLPAHKIEARAISPDRRWEIVVEEYDPGNMGVLWRTFKICDAGDLGESPESVDGSIYYLRELLSGGIEITNMKVYWVGTKAVVSSNGYPLLEWDRAHETEWHMVPDPRTNRATTMRSSGK